MNGEMPIRVMHVTFDMRIGGTEQVIRNLIDASGSESIEMSIFCIEEPLGPWGLALRDQGVSIRTHPRRPGFDLRVVRSLRRHLRRAEVSILHCHQYTPWVYGTLAALGTRTRVLFTEHGRFYPDQASPKRRFINPLLARCTDHMTAISQATKQALVDYEYLEGSRIDVIYNGIRGLDPQPEAVAALRREWSIPDGAPVLGTIARFDPIKNHPMMLEAFRRVLQVHPEARLLLVGDGEERATIEAAIDTLGLRERVVLPGYIPEPGHWLDAMDVFLLSSLSEGTSMTLLEALSLGKRCVVTDVGGNPEVVEHGFNGFVTPSGDADAFARAILDTLASGHDQPNAGERIIDRWRERFSSQAMIAAFARRYRDLAVAET